MLLLSLMLLLLCGCDEANGPGADNQNLNRYNAGHWNPLRPPPNAPKGMVCAVWESAYGGNTARGGPVCWIDIEKN